MKKPAIAFQLEEIARSNLERKVAWLGTQIANGALPPDVPSSLRRFNAWESEGTGGVPTFQRNANETLNKHPDLKAVAAELMGAAQTASQINVKPRDASLQRARDQVQLHLTIRKIAEAALVSARSENGYLLREVEALRAQMESMAEEMTRIREEYNNDLAKARARYAELLQTRSANVRAIKRGE
jgi:hypothetical protein